MFTIELHFKNNHCYWLHDNRYYIFIYKQIAVDYIEIITVLS